MDGTRPRTAEGGGRRKRGGQRSTEVEKVYVGGGCVGVLELLRGGGFRLGLALNISNGINGGLESMLRGVSQSNMGLGIFQETNITDGVYTCR